MKYEYKYKVGDSLKLIEDYHCGIDISPVGYTGIVLRLEYGMYEMKMSDGALVGWSESLLEPA